MRSSGVVVGKQQGIRFNLTYRSRGLRRSTLKGPWPARVAAKRARREARRAGALATGCSGCEVLGTALQAEAAGTIVALRGVETRRTPDTETGQDLIVIPGALFIFRSQSGATRSLMARSVRNEYGNGCGGARGGLGEQGISSILLGPLPSAKSVHRPFPATKHVSWRYLY